MKKLPKYLIHILAVVVMLIASCIYFAPALSGDVIRQGDMQKAEAMAHEQMSVKEQTGSIPNWNPSMFSGMPGYQTAFEAQHSVFTPLKALLIMRPLGVERSIGILWLYLIGFYVAMIALGCSPLLSLMGALAFGLGSYNIIIVEAGHITKAWAISMIAPMLAAMVLALRSVTREDDKYRIRWKQLVWGFILFTLATGLQITFNHIQITYYAAIGGVLLGIVYLIYAIKERWFKQFLAVVGVLLVGALFAVGGNYRHLTVNQEYMQATMRGGSEITVTPADLGVENGRQQEASQSGGLNIDYAFSWSYGVGETYTLLVPGAMGGGSGERVSPDSEWAQRTGQQQAPLYWGDQPFTSGPVYFGALVIFLFVLGLFLVRGPELWWLLAATVLAILMSWGRHFPLLNEFLFNHLPLYNKFRTPSMSLVLANATMVIMAVLALKQLFLRPEGDDKKNSVQQYDMQKRLNRALYWSAGIVGGILIVGIVLAQSSLSFTGVGDEQYRAQMGEQFAMFQDMLVNERKHLFVSDSWRSLLFVALAFVCLWFHVNKKMGKNVTLVVLCLLAVVDLWGVDRRYLNKDNFTSPESVKLYKTPLENELDRVAALNGDADYRVYDLSVNTFNDSRPSAFHHQIGGYSAAKLRRYQDLIDFYLGSPKFYQYVNNCGIEMADGANNLLRSTASYPVLDMLNARYMMMPLSANNVMPVRRTTALGSAWFVEQMQWVEDANAEILALDSFDPYRTAVVDKSQWDGKISDVAAAPRDSSETLTLVQEGAYNPDRLTYRSHSKREHVAVFSEVYYAPDWRAYIDGKPVDHFRADYILRALVVPAGDHQIEFVNEAPTLHRNDTITLIISIVMLVVMAAALVWAYRKERRQA